MPWEKKMAEGVAYLGTHEAGGCQWLKSFTEEDDALLAELGVEVEAKKAGQRAHRAKSASSPVLKRFSALLKNMAALPQHGEERDIFERLYAVRLDRIRELARVPQRLFEPIDRQGLLAGEARGFRRYRKSSMMMRLLAELGIELEGLTNHATQSTSAQARKRRCRRRNSQPR
jgi:hypothetical protein